MIIGSSVRGRRAAAAAAAGVGVGVGGVGGVVVCSSSSELLMETVETVPIVVLFILIALCC